MTSHLSASPGMIARSGPRLTRPSYTLPSTPSVKPSFSEWGSSELKSPWKAKRKVAADAESVVVATAIASAISTVSSFIAVPVAKRTCAAPCGSPWAVGSGYLLRSFVQALARIGMRREPMAGDFDPPGDPNVLVPHHVVEQALQ